MIRLDNEQANPGGKEGRDVEAEEFRAQLATKKQWVDIETEESNPEPFNFSLARSLLLLAGMIRGRDAPCRVLPLAASCIDCPLNNTHASASGLIMKIGAYCSSGDMRSISPDWLVP